jgi:hypothetical protein
MAQNTPYIKNDRFGNPYQLIGCKVNDKGFAKGYIELGGKLFKIEPSVSQNEKYAYWVKVTAVKKQSLNKSM